mmetsp:Transcript_8695/g.12997  ORF Transcript_8695/g.12997 Transcript_8695/m.12997 type:complete len:719 (-) Transcript_8695:92-2248(-)
MPQECDSDEAYKTLELIEMKLKVHVAKITEEENPSQPPSSKTKSRSDVNETLVVLFTLLFEFTEPGQLKTAQKCGSYIAKLISNTESFLSPDHEETIIQSLLIISALCNYASARSFIVENTPILRICIDAVVKLKGNDKPRKNSLRDKILSCLSTLVRGYVNEAVDAGIVSPMIDLLANDEVVSDQMGAAAIILSLIEPEDGQALGKRVLLNGVVPLLLQTLAKRIPKNATATDKSYYKNLQVVGLRCVACLLRHQKLLRESAGQFFATEDGERHLRSVVEHAKVTSDVSKWIFAAEILVWLGSVKSCEGLLGRMGAKQALRKVIAEANPYGKWVSLVNQSVSVKTFPVIWTTESVFFREQHGFLALWMNRYACGGLQVSADANLVREELCSEEWISFAMQNLASPDPMTRKHSHIALLSLRGEVTGIPSSIGTDNLSQSSSFGSSTEKTRNNSESFLYTHLLKNIGLERTEEKKIIDCLKKAKLPLHVILRRGIPLDDITKALTNISLGSRLAVIDGMKELRRSHKAAENIVKAAAQRENITKVTTIAKTKRVNNGQDNLKKNERAECFISYCWAQKDKVKILKETLEEHGIKCWMDEQQMEGGSMLFQEIDEGISASDVVISCLSPEYTKSINCNREALLAADRKKTTIPVIVEKLSQWPPRGNLGPILAGKLYIKMDDEAIQAREKSNEMQQLIESVLELLNTSSTNESTTTEVN